MANAGFYCRPLSGSNDNCCCYLCDKNLDGWEATDEAWIEHVKHAANCPLVRLDIESNRTLTFTCFELWPFNFKESSLNPEKV